MKIEPNCIYESYKLRGHARHRYIYTWINENGKLVANNTYNHGDFKKTFDSYEYSYDIKKLEKMEDLSFVGKIDDFEMFKDFQKEKNYSPEVFLKIPLGKDRAITYIKKNSRPSKEKIINNIIYKRKDIQRKLENTKKELEYINQYIDLIGTEDEYLLYGYEDSSSLIKPSLLKELSSHDRLLEYK